MRNSTQQTSQATFIRETSGLATTTVIAVTSCQETINKLHYGFRLFDDICLMQINELNEDIANIHFPKDFKVEQLQEGQCFLLTNEQQTLSHLSAPALKNLMTHSKLSSLSASNFNKTINNIKEATRRNRKITPTASSHTTCL